MTTLDFLNALEATRLASDVRGDNGWVWLFPIVETFHVISFTLVFGTIAMVDLRLLGLNSRNIPVSRLTSECLPWTWVAFVCAVTTGTMLFISKAHIYFYNLQFDLKFLFMFLAGVNMMVFHVTSFRRVAQWDSTLPPPFSARVAGFLSLAFWIAVIFFGRWIGFTT